MTGEIMENITEARLLLVELVRDMFELLTEKVDKLREDVDELKSTAMNRGQ